METSRTVWHAQADDGERAFDLQLVVNNIVGYLFGDAGLRNLAVKSRVIAEGSIHKIIDVKQSKRTVRLHKLTSETLMRLAWSGFEEWLEANRAVALPKYNATIRVVYKVPCNTWYCYGRLVISDDY